MVPDSVSLSLVAAVRRLLPYGFSVLGAGLAGWWLAGALPGNAEPQTPGAAVQGRVEHGVRRAAGRIAGEGERATGNARALATMDKVFAGAEGFLQRIAEADAAALPALHKELLRLPDRAVTTRLVELALFRRWVELDPSGGLKWVRKNDPNRTTLLLSVWARRDPAAADAGATAEGIDSSANTYAPAVAATAEELKRMMEYALIDHPGGLRCFVLVLTGWKLAALDPAAAKDLYARLPADLQSAAAGEIAENLSGGPQDALAWALSLPPGQARDSAIRSSIRRLAWTEPDAARAALQEHGLDEESARMVLSPLAAAYGEKGAAALLQFLREWPGKDNKLGQGISDLSVGAASVEDLNSLFDQADSFGISIVGDRIDWSGRDVAADLRGLAALPADGHRNTLVSSLLRFADDHGMPIPAETLSGLPPEIRGQAAAMLAGQKLGEGNLAAARALMQMADPGAVLQKAWRFNSADSLPLVLDLVRRMPESDQPIVWQGLGGAMAGWDPTEALELAASLPEVQQPAAWEGISRGMVGADALAASEQVNALPPGPNRDAAILGLGSGLAEAGAPEDALPWALAVSDDARRLAVLKTTAEAWWKQDPVAAAEQLGRMELPPAEREVIESVLNKKP